jgi:hypothetical protein
MHRWSRVAVVFCLLIIGLANCVEPFEPGGNIIPPQLVVSGEFTNRPGPHTIALSYTSINSKLKVKSNQFPKGAQVQIEEDGGPTLLLETTGGGIYKTALGVAGVPGRKYRIRIQLQDGTIYRSSYEQMPAEVVVDQVYSEFRLDRQDNGVPGFFDVLLDSDDEAGVSNYYKWSWEHYYKLDYCNIFKRPNDETNYAQKCCNDCWGIDRREEMFTVTSDKLFDGQPIKAQAIAEVPYDSRDPYYILVKQQALTFGYFEYWRLVREQLDNTGGIFDKTPSTIYCNVTSESNPDEQVLGYFGVVSETVIPFYVDRDDLEISPPSPGAGISYSVTPTCLSCIDGQLRSSRAPIGWEE